MNAAALPASVSERLVSFLQEWSARGAPPEVLHEAKRLLLNQLKASVGATSHEAVRILHAWARSTDRTSKAAQVLWFGDRAGAEQAIMVNGALFEVLDYHDTYIPTFMHATSAVLPAVLAAGEIHGKSGREVLNALALGMEAELAVATILMPTGYYRGFVPAGLVGGVGAAAGCAVLAGLDATRMRNAIGLAMCTAFGTYESVGSMALSYITGATARSGFTAFQLAERGLDAPRTAFEGEKGMLSSCSNESAEKIDGVLASLGSTWRIHGQTYKTVPTETITHGPIECVLALCGRADGRTVKRMRFGVEAIVVKIADERRERFGNPNSELTARFDTRFCAAAAWQRGRFTLDEMREAAYNDAAILDLRSRIDLVADPSFKTFNGAALEIAYTDGTTDSIRVPAFLGTPENRLSDQQLADVFSLAAKGLLPDARSAAVLEAVWGLERASSLQPLMALLTIT
jgi:2-methylcitrate dehydratase PrpD